MTGGSASALELSRPAQASPLLRPIGSLSSPKAAFVAGLRPSQLPGRVACQLPDQSTIIRVRPSLTGSSRPRGARSFASVRVCPLSGHCGNEFLRQRRDVPIRDIDSRVDSFIMDHASNGSFSPSSTMNVALGSIELKIIRGLPHQLEEV